MDGTCSTCEIMRNWYKILARNSEEKRKLVGRTILKCNLEKSEWTELAHLQVNSDDHSVFMKAGCLRSMIISTDSFWFIY